MNTVNHQKLLVNATRIIVIIVSMLVTLTIGYCNQIQPLYMQIKNSQQQQITIKIQLQKNQLQIQKLLPWQKQWKNLEKKLLAIQKTPHAPEQMSAAIVLKNIAEAIVKSQLTTISLTPNTSPNHQPNKLNLPQLSTLLSMPITPPTPQNYNLTATGNYRQIIYFLSEMSNSADLLIRTPTFTIRQFSNENNSNSTGYNNKLIFNTTLQIVPIDHEKYHDKIIDAIDPFCDRALTTLLSLTTWDSKELQFFGKINQRGKTVGIISDPSKQFHYVTVGTIIGLKHSKIIKITEDAILTINDEDNIYR